MILPPHDHVMGHVRDSATVGTRYFVDNTGAVVTTGNGYVMMKSAISIMACLKMTDDAELVDAVQESLQLIKGTPGGRGGVIAINSEDKVGICYGTESMISCYLASGMDVPSFGM